MTANTTASVRAFADRRWLCLISAMVICVCAGFGYAWSVLQTPIIARFPPGSQQNADSQLTLYLVRFMIVAKRKVKLSICIFGGMYL